MGEMGNQMESVSFTRMADVTAEEYAFLTPLYEKWLLFLHHTDFTDKPL